MIKLAISGAQGRMGQAISKLAFADNDVAVVTLLEHPQHPKASEKIEGTVISTDSDSILGCDVLIDFTLPDGTMANLDACMNHNVRMVIGTTGFTEEQRKKIENASNRIPIVLASNMSIGVNVLFKAIELVGKKIGDATININETHHVHKKDAPSGTAKTMGEIAEAASGKKIMNIESFREGEVIGDHDITFETQEDVLKISHHAKTRNMFAKGAITAAKFLADHQTGLYSMQDVLGLTHIEI